MTSSRPTRRRKSDAPVLLAAALLALLLFSCAATAAPLIVHGGIPASADAGTPIEVWVDVNSTVAVDEVLLSYNNPGTGQMDYLLMNLTAGDDMIGRWCCTIPPQPWEGTVECRVTATDISGASAQYPPSWDAVIRIVGQGEPKPFPWNLVFVIGFLGVTLVLTELAFKPGFYRKTGRERARELEEEDRKAGKEREGEP